MEIRHILLIVALFATVILVIPTVFSFFGGQHFFYENDRSYCLKCHSDIRQELDSSVHHFSFTCENCHGSNGSNPPHDNMTIPGCLDCHGTPPRLVTDSKGNTFVSPIAKIFGENITNQESHNPFVESAILAPAMKSENEACVSCHTTKSIAIDFLYADTYRVHANRNVDNTWQLVNYSKNTELASPLLATSIESAGRHVFPSTSQLKCEKCHSNVRDQLVNSSHHTFFSCGSCHKLDPEFHASSTPQCLDCHGTTPKMVTDLKGNTFVAPVAAVYAAGQGGADAHLPFVLGANTSNLAERSNIACSSCHSSFNNNIVLTRPDFIEWDVVNSSGTWTIQNLNFGPGKEISIQKYLDGKSHNISMVTNTGCISCHDDIRQAVTAGGHSNEQWKNKHASTNYNDMDSYCISCHRPSTQNSAGISPYPAYPFNSPVHGAMKITCMDCHGKSGILYANIDGLMQTPTYNSSGMGNIEASITQQPDFVQTYLCISCKNTGNPVPNTSLHFKINTEPQVIIYINGTQRYP